MTDPPPWMETYDARLLELLASAGEGYPLTVAVIASETGFDEDTVVSRLDDLARRGLVGAAGPDAYHASAEGVQFVEERLSSPTAETPPGPEERPAWMERGDLRILDLLANADGPVTVEELAVDLDALEAYARRRCERLAAEGLIQPIGTEAVELRDLGRAFLDGEVDAGLLDADG